jgi:hypothetical protein
MLRPLATFAFAFCVAAATPTAAAGTLGDPTPGGWAPVDAHGVHRHAALGLFPSSKSSALQPTQATVSKSAANPLFGQDKMWETRIDNGYPNVVYDPDAATRGDGPWRLWYGNIGPKGVGGQYLLYANSTDGLSWDKPDLGRYDLEGKWKNDPAVSALGKHNNIIMEGGGLGIYRDMHERDSSLRYKASGGAPEGCYSDGGDKDCRTCSSYCSSTGDGTATHNHIHTHLTLGSYFGTAR